MLPHRANRIFYGVTSLYYKRFINILLPQYLCNTYTGSALRRHHVSAMIQTQGWRLDYVKQHINTIPIWDAYRTDCECPLCWIEKNNEAMYVDNFLGGSVMEPSTRIEVNQKGFCSAHFRQLYDAQNRLGLSLMAQTYMKETMQVVNESVAQLLANKSPGKLSSMLGKKRNQPSPLQAIAHRTNTCILCDRLNATMQRYVYTLVYLWSKESEFQKLYAASKGFCMPHYIQLLQSAPEELSGKKLDEFLKATTTLQRENMERIEKELEWFTLKFDYRNQDKPWNNSRDAVERSLNKLRGRVIDNR